MKLLRQKIDFLRKGKELTLFLRLTYPKKMKRLYTVLLVARCLIDSGRFGNISSSGIEGNLGCYRDPKIKI